MSDDPVSPLFDYDISFADVGEGKPPTPRALFRRLGLPKTATLDDRQLALDRWLEGGNEPSPFLAQQLRRQGFRLPSKLSLKLESLLRDLDAAIVAVTHNGQPVPSYLGAGTGQANETGDRYEIQMTQHGNGALLQATLEERGWRVVVLDVDSGVDVLIDGETVGDGGVVIEPGDRDSIVDYIMDSTAIS